MRVHILPISPKDENIKMEKKKKIKVEGKEKVAILKMHRVLR